MAESNRIHIGRPVKDLQGRRFSSLTVIEFAGIGRDKIAYWKCLCDCGQVHVSSGNNLQQGRVKSCGCRRGVVNRARLTTHGKRNTSEYKAWRSIKLRCFCPSSHNYADYGGRGIVACEGINNSFEYFHSAVGDKPFRGASIDRIDNERGYDCGQCDDCRQRKASCNMQWANWFQQAQNRRGNHKITHDGQTLCLAEWSRITGLSSPTIRERLARGWNVHDALTVHPLDGPSRRFHSS